MGIKKKLDIEIFAKLTVLPSLPVPGRKDLKNVYPVPVDLLKQRYPGIINKCKPIVNLKNFGLHEG